MKEMFNVWDAHVIFDLIKNKLEHENDGLIFTIDAAPYYMGSCHHILKWKPEHLNTIDFNAFPISKTPLNDTFVWSLHTRHGDLFDFICLSKIDNEKYLLWMKENKKDSCVLECNFDREVDLSAAHLLNSLKKKHDMDCEDLDQQEVFTEGDRNRLAYTKRQKRKERG